MPALNGRSTRLPSPLPELSPSPDADVPIVVSVCISCRSADGPDTDRPGEALIAALRSAARRAGSTISVRPVQCLSVCKRPCTVALSSPGRYTYLFGDLDPAADIPALLEGVATYARQEHGYMLWRERPEALRKGILARIPPTGWDAEDGRHPR